MELYVVGIDEVGRGALAGPVCICLFFATEKNLETIVSNAPCIITDSKKVSAKKREVLALYFKECKKQQLCTYSIVSMDAEHIDMYGISVCLKNMIRKGLHVFSGDLKDLFIKLDGGLSAPKEYRQEVFIKGDEREKIISCASIVAKVYRDSYMKKQALLFTEYEFDRHVGYGTEIHRDAIKKHGLSVLHRKTFCRALV